MILITPLMNTFLAGINAGPCSAGNYWHATARHYPDAILFGIRAPNTAHLTSFKEYDAANTRAIM